MAQSTLWLRQKERIDGICFSPFGNVAANISEFARCLTFRANIRGNCADPGETTNAAMPVCYAAPRTNILDESACRTISTLCADPQLFFSIHFLFLFIPILLKFDECLTRLCSFRQPIFHQFTNLLGGRKMIMSQNLPYTFIECHGGFNSNAQFVPYLCERLKS